jgi:hypothetical protein
VFELRQAALRRQIENAQRACHAKAFLFGGA